MDLLDALHQGAREVIVSSAEVTEPLEPSWKMSGVSVLSAGAAAARSPSHPRLEPPPGQAQRPRTSVSPLPGIIMLSVYMVMVIGTRLNAVPWPMAMLNVMYMFEPAYLKVNRTRTSGRSRAGEPTNGAGEPCWYTGLFTAPPSAGTRTHLMASYHKIMVCHDYDQDEGRRRGRRNI